jgi:hypothetical protein
MRTIAMALCLLLTGCNRQRVIKVEMTWECAPDQYKSWAPDAQPVRFKYVADPQYEEVVSGPGLCDQLKASGKKVVVVEYEAWGDYFHGLVGYNEISVDGKPLVNAGGWGSSLHYSRKVIQREFFLSVRQLATDGRNKLIEGLILELIAELKLGF